MESNSVNSANSADFDIVVVGGGINGAGIARDAAGRGYRVCLIEQHDLAQATSSASTKLIHGGLRYLEQYDFGLVRKSLQERDILQRAAPHIIWPMRFILPHHKGLRPAWLIRLGLFLYDHIGGKQLLPKSSHVRVQTHPAGKILTDAFTTAFTYSDYWVEDSRLVVLNAMDAQNKGAEIKTHTKLISAKPRADEGQTDEKRVGWQLEVQNAKGESEALSCHMLVNAAGPWAMDVLQRSGGGGGANQTSLRLIKGSHLIFDRKMPSEDAFLLQNTDGRISFMIPYEGRFTLVGTTDVDVSDRLDVLDAQGKIDISEAEIDYLLAMVNPYLQDPLSRDIIVASYAGVRPLYDDGSHKAAKANRDYHLEVSHHDGAALLSIFGGKLTTYRRLAESALTQINKHFDTTHPSRTAHPSWTANAVLPGGDFESQQQLIDDLQTQISDMPEQVARRLVRAYGTKTYEFVGDATQMQALGRQFGCGLSEAELGYLVAHEYAKSAEDVLWRRSKLQLHLNDTEIAAVEAWLAGYLAAGAQN